MTNVEKIQFELHLILSVIIVCCYIVYMVINKDELEEKAQSYALKWSNLVTIIFFICYTLYKSVVGNVMLSPHIILIIINALCVLYLLFYFLYIKGLAICFKFKNIKILNAICYLSAGISVVLTVTQILKVKFFEISPGFIRLDTLLTMINLIIISLIIGVYPSKKLSREDYKKREVTASKFSKIFIIFYGLATLCLIGYAIYKFYMK